MKVLVACEFSGTARDSFLNRGHDAMSCDILPTDAPGPHYHGDVRDVLCNHWDLIVAHPPCTYLTNSGVRWLTGEKAKPGRWRQLDEGAAFFKLFLDHPCGRIAVENPIMHKYAIERIGRRHDQLVQQYQFGHPERKATCLWLKGLPPLQPTHDVKAEMLARPKREAQRLHWLPPSKDRAKLRSKTYQGIAEAMAEQWCVK